MNNINTGSFAESLFDSECMLRGYNSSKPICDTDYDRVIEVNEKLLKIQIKCIGNKDKKFRVFLRRNYNSAVDYYAVYNIQERSWYFFPYSKQTSVRVSERNQRLENKNNWGILK
jgi:hypothetical protein